MPICLSAVSACSYLASKKPEGVELGEKLYGWEATLEVLGEIAIYAIRSDMQIQIMSTVEL
jgi:hypothetical protein